MGQISPMLDKPGTFEDQISVNLGQSDRCWAKCVVLLNYFNVTGMQFRITEKYKSCEWIIVFLFETGLSESEIMCVAEMCKINNCEGQNCMGKNGELLQSFILLDVFKLHASMLPE